MPDSVFQNYFGALARKPQPEEKPLEVPQTRPDWVDPERGRPDVDPARRWRDPTRPEETEPDLEPA